MFGPRSGTMVPDKVPRKVMGGGFRSHSPPRSSTAKTTGGVWKGMNDDPAGTPRSGQGAKRPGRGTSGKEKLIMAQEQEAADIEREYIKNLQQQVYYLELELTYTKQNKARAPQEHRQHQQQQQQQQGAGGGEYVGDAFQAPTPGARSAGGGWEGSGAAPSSYPAPLPAATTPYAAVAAVREAAERACLELQRTRTQQLEEAANRAYDITAQILKSTLYVHI
jgi:hypothetical protein